ncbi:MAG: zincin-like metallopeptidase domain-containing protein [Candidatus Tectimicrobiota bacterium]
MTRRLWRGLPQRPALRHGYTQAYYRPEEDVVYLPSPERFECPEAYYSIVYHELSHSTGHPSRLNRATLKNMVRFGDPYYSKEELIAEMAAAMLCGVTGIAQSTIDQSASYLQGWLRALRADPKLLVLAAAQAQRAADFIQGVPSRA